VTSDQAHALLTAVCSIAAPFLISLAKQRHWSDAQKGMAALAVSVCLGLATVAATGHLDWKDIAGTIGVVFTTATWIYQNFLKGTTINDALTDATLPGTGGPKP
jgi:biotin transporter BioY